MCARQHTSPPAESHTLSKGVIFYAALMVYNATMQPGSTTTKYYGAAAQYNKTGGTGGRLIKIALLILGAIILLSAAFIGITALTSIGRTDAARLVAREKQLLTFLTINQTSISTDDFQTAKQ